MKPFLEKQLRDTMCWFCHKWTHKLTYGDTPTFCDEWCKRNYERRNSR